MSFAPLLRNYYRAFTRNLKYDRETSRILRRVLEPTSSCIDVGSRHGKILRRMIRFAPEGKHAAFEPLPQAFRRLHKKFGGERSVRLFNVALAEEKGRRSFISVIRYPGYSGFRRHFYPGATRCEEISVSVWALPSHAASVAARNPAVSRSAVRCEASGRIRPVTIESLSLGSLFRGSLFNVILSPCSYRWVFTTQKPVPIDAV